MGNQFLLGQGYQQAGQLDKAKKIYEDLFRQHPDNYQFFQLLNNIYIQLKEYDSSIKIIEEKLKLSPTDINLYGLLGSAYYLSGQEDKAFKIWDDALKKLPESQVNYRVLANYAIERRAFDKAIELLKRGKAVSKDPKYFSYDLANLYAVTMQFKKAAEEYCSILDAEPNQQASVQSRIFNYITKPEALTQTIQVVEKWKDKNISFSYLLARLYIEAKYYDKAYKIYLNIDSKQQNQGSELFTFAQILYGNEQYNLAAQVYKEILKKYPNSPLSSSVKMGYAKTLEAVLDDETKKETPSWKPYYVIIPVSASKVDEIVSAYSALIKLYPHSEIANEALLRIGKIKLYKENNLSDAEKYFHQIVDDSPLSQYAPEAFIQLAKISLQNGNLTNASYNFQKVIKAPRSSSGSKNYANYMLARINFYEGNFNKAKELLANNLDKLDDNSANDALALSLLLNTSMNDSSNLVKFARAEFLTEQDKFKEAGELYKQTSLEQNALILSNLSKLRQAEIELAQNNFDSSIKLLENIADKKEKNIYADKALYLMAKIYQYGLNDLPRAVDIYEKLLAKFPNSLYLNQAREQITKLRNKLS